MDQVVRKWMSDLAKKSAENCYRMNFLSGLKARLAGTLASDELFGFLVIQFDSRDAEIELIIVVCFEGFAVTEIGPDRLQLIGIPNIRSIAGAELIGLNVVAGLDHARERRFPQRRSKRPCP